MKKWTGLFRDSVGELRAVPSLTACAMLAALALILNSVASINIGPFVKIGFSAIPNQMVDFLFGPITGTLFAGVLDIVKYFLRPDGPFFFGFTFNAMLAAFIYGCFYYHRKLTFPRVLAAKLTVVLVVNVFFNTLWLSMLYGQAFLAILPARTLKNLIMWPIDSGIFASSASSEKRPRLSDEPHVRMRRTPVHPDLTKQKEAPFRGDGR